VRQTRPDFEFLIADDGSTDRTPAILSQWMERDARLRVVRGERAGLTRSLNRLLSLATGAYVARMDADDVSFPDRFARQIAFLESHPMYVAVGSAILWIDPEGELLHESVWPEDSATIERLLLRGKGGLPHPAMMSRRAALEKIGGYREQFRVAQDKDLWLRLLDVGLLANLREPLLYYRQHPLAISTRHTAEQWRMTCQAVQDACRRRGIPVPKGMRRKWVRPKSLLRQYCSWSRRARAFGNLRAARKYAQRAVALKPWRPEPWWCWLMCQGSTVDERGQSLSLSTSVSLAQRSRAA
jgi:hypothetical protein